MDIKFKQRIIIAFIGGLFIFAAAYISKSESQTARMTNSSIITGGNNVAIANRGNATSVSNVNIVDQRVTANNGKITISGDGGNISINQNSNNISKVNIHGESIDNNY